MSSVIALSLPPFKPPARFDQSRFDTYQPQHSSQEAALEQSQAFVLEATEPVSFRWPWQRKEQSGRGLYLDGGFGVGKTHLLAAAFHACDAKPKAYLSFQELVYSIGVLGMPEARQQLGAYQLMCIDEFELDDPGNTLIVKTFLSHAFEQGMFVITTSNTIPSAQGQGRFNADDFKREIQSIASKFTTLSIEGPDYRKRDHLARLLSSQQFETRSRTEQSLDYAWPEFLRLLEAHHPIRYYQLLAEVDGVFLEAVETIPDQNNALRFVHFIDKLYDLKKHFYASGSINLEDIFHPSYRQGAYAKKHYRCLSRLSELLEES